MNNHSIAFRFWLELKRKHGISGSLNHRMIIADIEALLNENAAEPSVQADLLPCGHSKENRRWSLPEGVEYCAACAATIR